MCVGGNGGGGGGAGGRRSAASNIEKDIFGLQIAMQYLYSVKVNKTCAVRNVWWCGMCVCVCVCSVM